MNALLRGVFNSRINLNLREHHGYTYGARSQFAFRRQAGPFVVGAPVRNEVTRAVEEVLIELRRIRTGDIEDLELNDVKSYLMGVFPAKVQTASDVGNRVADMKLYGLPLLRPLPRKHRRRVEGGDHPRGDEVPGPGSGVDYDRGGMRGRFGSRWAGWGCRFTSWILTGMSWGWSEGGSRNLWDSWDS